MTFALIAGVAAILALSLYGVGRLLEPKDGPGAAAIRGWSLFFLLCAIAWFGRFPAQWLAPALWLLVGIGLVGAVRDLRIGVLAGSLAGIGLITAAYALPFLLSPHLWAYAYLGTDQWGYASVARWLLRHPVNELPAIDNLPGRDWIWLVLSIRDRPLAYISLAGISGMAGCATIVSYTILPVALNAAVFLALFLREHLLGCQRASVRFFLALGISLQPLVVLHFLHQFVAGAIMGLLLMLLTAAVLDEQPRRPGSTALFPYSLLLCALSAGLYSAVVAVTAGGLMAAIWAGSLLALREKERAPWRRGRVVLMLVLLTVAGSCFVAIRILAPEPLAAPMGAGRAGHVWSQLGGLYGQTAITPWYMPDGTGGGLDPVAHDPPGARLRTVCLIALMAFLLWHSATALRRHRDPSLLLLALGVGLVLARALPPRGSHWLVSRSLPVFGPALVVAAAAAIGERERKWSRAVAGLLACGPLLLGAAGLWSYISAPPNQFFGADGNRPPVDEVWHALAYDYFFEEVRPIDWSKAPRSFTAMTHYMPENIRPRLPAFPPPPRP